MAAHPIISFDLRDGDTFTVPQGNNLVTPIEVIGGTNVLVRIVHTAATQDLSLRCWFSSEPGGLSLAGGPELAFWHPGRKAASVHCLQNGGDVVRDDGLVVYALPVEPGIYYLNVLNLVNGINKFFVEVAVSS
jgi:hypothetical protein